MPLVPISSDQSRSRGKYITLDKFGRLMLSSDLRKEFNINAMYPYLHVAYDVENHRIGIQKPDLVRKSATGIEPFKFDKRGYTYARNIVDKSGLPKNQTFKFVDAGHEFVEGERWRLFELVRDKN
ncbi:hypothetical protein WD019_02415 [Fictibacillus sp. Mic-4]|uniref:hypothetical protein n=1 Tax=Fictibacillus sp. Mic-4 TaxID=3132826 RepID=UPI003CF26539